MKKLMQSSDKSTYLRAEKTRLGCGLCSRIRELIGEKLLTLPHFTKMVLDSSFINFDDFF